MVTRHRPSRSWSQHACAVVTIVSALTGSGATGRASAAGFEHLAPDASTLFALHSVTVVDAALLDLSGAPDTFTGLVSGFAHATFDDTAPVAHPRVVPPARARIAIAEPGSVMLFFVGLLGLCWTMQRRARRAR